MKTTRIARHKGLLLKSLSLIAGLPLVLLLTSCMTVGNKFTLAQVEKLQIGRTIMPEVRSLFGSPTREIHVATWTGRPGVHFGDETTATIWRYVHGSAQARSLQIDFDKEGKVVDYYYSSDFAVDKTAEPVKQDFNIFQAKEKIVAGKTAKAEVVSLLGNNYRLIPINKPNTSERWHYGFTDKCPKKMSDGSVWNKTCGKSLDIDFDSQGMVADVRGESDFPGDLARQAEAQQPKSPPPKSPQEEIIEASRPATNAEISSINTELQRRISPFTPDEIRNGAGGSRNRTEGGRTRTVTVQTLTASGYVKTDVFVKEGAQGVRLSDMLAGNVGAHVLTIRKRPNEPDSITFVDNHVYTTFQKTADGKWMVEKYKFVER